MPRNGSGTYTLPSGNPVVSGTIIESTWANSTLADLADSITNSLARNGEGGMTAPLRLTDGVVATPSLAFANETGSGLYRAAAGDLGLSVLGSRILRLQAAGASVAGTFGVSGDTSLANLAYTDTLTGGTGVINIGSGQIYKSVGGDVGIGTTSPLSNLHIYSTALTSLSLTDATLGSNYGGTIRGFGQAGLGGYCEIGVLDAGSYSAGIQIQQQSAQIIFFGNAGTSERMRINSSGYVGINTNSPSALLDVNGNSIIRGTLGVTGASTLASLGVTANATVGGTLGVTGASTLATLGVTSNATVGGTLGVTGASTLASLGVTANATVGGTLGVTGVATLTANPVLSAGTANGVAYLNGSKSLTTGSGFVFDGTNIGAGVTSPVGRVDVVTNGYSAFVARSASSGTNVDVIGLKAIDSAAANFANVAYQAKSHVWGYNGSSLGMVLDASGNVGIGTNSPISKLHLYSTSTPLLALTDATVGSSYGGAVRGFGQAGLGGYCEIGVLDAGGYSAGIQIQQQSNQIIFFGNAGANERGRFNSTGRFLINTTSVIGGDGSMLNVNNGIATGVGTTALSAAIGFHNPNGRVGYIGTDGTTTSYVTSSDYRLKENVQPMQNALAKVAALNPVTFTWKVDGRAGQGFIAHELQAVVPDCVTGEKDAVRSIDLFDEDGNKIGTEETPDYQGVDTSFLVATLAAAIQELKAEVDALKAAA